MNLCQPVRGNILIKIVRQNIVKPADATTTIISSMEIDIVDARVSCSHRERQWYLSIKKSCAQKGRHTQE